MKLCAHQESNKYSSVAYPGFFWLPGNPPPPGHDFFKSKIGLLLAITASDFISALVVTNKYLGYLRSLTCSLQAGTKDVVQAVVDIEVILTSLREVRNTIDQQHDAWFPGDWADVALCRCGIYWFHEGVRDSVTGITYQQMTPAPTTDAASLFHWLISLEN